MRIALVLLVVAGCKKNPCEQAGDHMFGAIAKHTAAWLSLTPEEMDSAKASLVEDCKMRPWDDGASSCIGRAIDAKDLEACTTMRNIELWRALVMQQVDPNGQKRYPEIDAVIAELVAAGKAISAEPGECKGAVPVVAIDRWIVESLAMKQKIPEKTPIVGESFTVALSRYLMKQQLAAGEVMALRKWIRELPKGRAWGIVETDLRIDPQTAGTKSFIEGEYLGTIHVIDIKQTALCQRAFSAHSSESVKTYFIDGKAAIGVDDLLQSDLHGNINKALDERIAKLHKGEPDPVAEVAPFRAELVPADAKWHCTENTQVRDLVLCGPDIKSCGKLRDGDEYTDCTPGGNVSCFSYHDIDAGAFALSCHPTRTVCAITRRIRTTIDKVDQVSRCKTL